MKSVALTDTPNEVSYLKRLLTREITRLGSWIAEPSLQNGKPTNIMRLREDLSAAQSILEKLG